MAHSGIHTLGHAFTLYLSSPCQGSLLCRIYSAVLRQRCHRVLRERRLYSGGRGEGGAGRDPGRSRRLPRDRHLRRKYRSLRRQSRGTYEEYSLSHSLLSLSLSVAAERYYSSRVMLLMDAVLTSDPRVSAFVIFLASFGDQAKVYLLSLCSLHMRLLAPHPENRL
jgi:hypothetical protein